MTEYNFLEDLSLKHESTAPILILGVQFSVIFVMTKCPKSPYVFSFLLESLFGQAGLCSEDKVH